MARRKKTRKSKARSSAARRSAVRRTKKSVRKHGRRRNARRIVRRRNVRRPARRRVVRRRNAARRVIRRRRPANLAGFPMRRNGRRPRRNALTAKELASYRRAISRYGSRRHNRGIFRGLRRNPLTSLMDTAKGLPVMMLRVGGGFVTSMLAGQFLGSAVSNEYMPLVGNLLAVAGSEMLIAKVPAAEKLGHEFTAGAAGAAFVSLMNLLVQKGILTGEIARYLAPWSEASVPVVMAPVTEPALVDAGTGAYVQQAALYGLGGSSVGAAMAHRLKMIEGGMSGGIFDSKTTLGEYDVLDSAPRGTMVQQGLAEYQVYPPSMGATVEQATAGFRGMGATVQEAFAGPGLREYVSTPLQGLRDYVNIGDQPVGYWRNSAQGSAILGEIRNAARQLTAARIASGQPVDATFRANLTKAALAAASGADRDVSMAAPTPPLTQQAAPFPGQFVGDQGGVYGQPVGIQNTAEAMEDEDGGIFA